MPTLPALPGTEKPTPEQAAAWFKREWKRWRTRRDKDELVRSRLFRTWTPDGSGPNGEDSELHQTVIKSGVARTLLREFTGILNSDQPRIEALADGLGPYANRKASEIEEWDVAWYQAVEGDDLKALIDSDQLAYGRGVSYVAWAQQNWDGQPGRADGEPPDTYNKRAATWRQERPQPIHWQHCPAPQTMFDSDLYDRNYGPPRACYWEHRPLSQIALEYPTSDAADRWRQLNDRDTDPEQLFVCFSNRRYTVYATANGMVTGAEDSQGPVSLLSDALTEWEFLVEPFEHGLSGNPFAIAVGDTSSDHDLVNRYAGLFDNSLELIDRIDDALTQYATAVRRYARAQAMVTREWGPNGQAPYGYDAEQNTVREIEWNTNRVLQFGPGERPGWWQPPLAEFQSAIELHTILSQYVQRDTLSPTSWGAGASTNSGYELVTLIQASERKLKPLIRREAKALQVVFNNVHCLVATKGTPVDIWRDTDEESDGGSTIAVGGYVTMAPKMAEKARVRVKLNPRLDSADAANMQLMLQVAQAVSAGFLDIDKDYLLSKFAGIENPERHRKAALLQRFLNNPEVQNWMTKYVLDQAQMRLGADDVEVVKALSKLTPAELLLAPKALQQVLAERGLIAPGAPGAVPPVDQGNQVGADGGSGLNALLSQSALQPAPAPGQPGTLPGSAPTNPLAQYTGASSAPSLNIPASALQSAVQTGQPASTVQAFQRA